MLLYTKIWINIQLIIRCRGHRVRCNWYIHFFSSCWAAASLYTRECGAPSLYYIVRILKLAHGSWLNSPSPWGGFTESLLSAIPNDTSHGPTWGRESLQIAHLFPIIRHVITRSCNKRGDSYEFYASISISLLRILLYHYTALSAVLWPRIIQWDFCVFYSWFGVYNCRLSITRRVGVVIRLAIIPSR